MDYDEIDVILPKGDKERIEKHARFHNESVEEFILRAIEETMEFDRKNDESDSEEDA